jgi:hypothetical protein
LPLGRHWLILAQAGHCLALKGAAEATTDMDWGGGSATKSHQPGCTTPPTTLA